MENFESPEEEIAYLRNELAKERKRVASSGMMLDKEGIIYLQSYNTLLGVEGTDPRTSPRYLNIVELYDALESKGYTVKLVIGWDALLADPYFLSHGFEYATMQEANENKTGRRVMLVDDQEGNRLTFNCLTPNHKLIELHESFVKSYDNVGKFIILQDGEMSTAVERAGDLRLGGDHKLGTMVDYSTIIKYLDGSNVWLKG